METTSAAANHEILPAGNKVHIIGAGPVGLFLAALLQSMEGFPVRLYEKRPNYTRTRMVKLSNFLVADSVESYCEDNVDAQTIQAVYDVGELEETLAFRQSIPPDLMSLLRTWVQGFCPLNTIEQALSKLIDERGTKTVERIETNMTEQEAIGMLRPGFVITWRLVPRQATLMPIHLTSILKMRSSSHLYMANNTIVTSIASITRMPKTYTISLFLPSIVPVMMVIKVSYRGLSISRQKTLKQCRQNSTVNGSAQIFPMLRAQWIILLIK